MKTKKCKSVKSVGTNYESMSYSVISCILAVFISLWPLLMFGCGVKEYRVIGGKEVTKKGQISKEELREKLNNFEDFFVNRYKYALSNIEENMPDVRTKNTTLRLRVRIPEALHTMLEQEDPIIAFIETWGLCVRTTNYFESGAGSNFFGERQDIMITAAKDIETEIERIGSMFLNETMLNETRSNILTFAGANPIQDTYTKAVVYMSAVKRGEPNPFIQTISIPLAPFRAMEGVDRGAEAINKFTNTAQSFTDVVEQLPETTRWQMQLLFYDLEETEMIKSIVASTDKISESSVKLAETTENLPQRIREEASILIEDIDEKQENIQATLEKAEKTSVAVERAFQGAVETADSIDKTAERLIQTANAWENTANAINQTLTEFQKMKPSPDNSASKPKFNINDYHDTAEAMTQTATELRALTTDLSGLIASDDFDKLLSMAQKLSNQVTWRIGLLILFAFLLALGYRFVSVLIGQSKPSRR